MRANISFGGNDWFGFLVFCKIVGARTGRLKMFRLIPMRERSNSFIDELNLPPEDFIRCLKAAGTIILKENKGGRNYLRDGTRVRNVSKSTISCF